MEVNKEQAEKCRDIGANALRQNNYERAVKMLTKSLRLYPLPGVPALLEHAQSKVQEQQNANGTTPTASNSSNTNNNNNNTTNDNTNTGADGRSYSPEQEQIVATILQKKNRGGANAHYDILNLPRDATPAHIKKSYRKLSLKVHPDKNSAPHADEAFKALSMAYATLSDPQLRRQYDVTGVEDPDHRPMRRGGHEMSPEDIFNAFFGGHPPGGFGNGGGGGVHFYSTGFGNGMHFRTGRRPRQQQRQQQQQQQQNPGFAMLLQLLPILFFMMLSFLASDNGSVIGSSKYMPGEGQYFSLSRKPPFVNPLYTKLSKVKDIPYFVNGQFLRTYHHDRFQLGRVEKLVQDAYENFLVRECTSQRNYRDRLRKLAYKEPNAALRQQKLTAAKEFSLNRCDELSELFPDRAS